MMITEISFKKIKINKKIMLKNMDKTASIISPNLIIQINNINPRKMVIRTNSIKSKKTKAKNSKFYSQKTGNQYQSKKALNKP